MYETYIDNDILDLSSLKETAGSTFSLTGTGQTIPNKSIIFNSNLNSDNFTKTCFQSCKFAKYIYLPLNFNSSVSFTVCRLLELDSIKDIANKLKDLSGEDTKTISFYTKYKYILPEEIIKIITDKNWTISFSS